MIPAGLLENPLRFLFGPGPTDIACRALSPECMGWIPFLASQVGFGS